MSMRRDLFLSSMSEHIWFVHAFMQIICDKKMMYNNIHDMNNLINNIITSFMYLLNVTRYLTTKCMISVKNYFSKNGKKKWEGESKTIGRKYSNATD